jgi:lysophospholipase L1-like esterase
MTIRKINEKMIDPSLVQKVNDHTVLLAETAKQADLNTTNANVTLKAEKTYVDTQIGNIGNASPKGTYATVTDLQTAFPTGTTGIYVVTADGKWYYWSGSAWTAGGTYQSTGLANNTVKNTNIADNAISPIKIDRKLIIFDKNKALQGYVATYPAGVSVSANWYLSDFIPVIVGDVIDINLARNIYLTTWGSNKAVLNQYDTGSSTAAGKSFTVPSGVSYIRVNVYIDVINSYTLSVNGIFGGAKTVVDWLDINSNNLKSGSVTSDKYADNSILPLKISQGIDGFNKDTALQGYASNLASGVYVAANWYLSDFIVVNTGDVVVVNQAQNIYLTTWNSSKAIIAEYSAPSFGQQTFTAPAGVSYIRVNVYKDYINTYTMTINGFSRTLPASIKWLLVTKDNLSSDIGIVSKWKNKKWVTLGDSITWYDKQAYAYWVGHESEMAVGYQSIVNTKVNSFAEILNKAASGTAMTDNGNANAGVKLGKTVNYALYDLVTIAHGTNDFKLDQPIGTLGAMGDTAFNLATFYGAYRSLVEYILTQKPTIKLVLFTPLQRNNGGYDVNFVNPAGHKLIDYVDAFKAIGILYGLPVLDLYANSEFNKFTLGTYTYDGLHPNNVGYKVIGDKVYNHIENVI